MKATDFVVDGAGSSGTVLTDDAREGGSSGEAGWRGRLRPSVSIG